MVQLQLIPFYFSLFFCLVTWCSRKSKPNVQTYLNYAPKCSWTVHVYKYWLLVGDFWGEKFIVLHVCLSGNFRSIRQNFSRKQLNRENIRLNDFSICPISLWDLYKRNSVKFRCFKNERLQCKKSDEPAFPIFFFFFLGKNILEERKGTSLSNFNIPRKPKTGFSQGFFVVLF